MYWRRGPLLGGGTSLFVSSFDSNLYFDASPGADATARLNDTGFPCAQSYGPVDPATADGIIYNGQSLFAPKVRDCLAQCSSYRAGLKPACARVRV